MANAPSTKSDVSWVQVRWQMRLPPKVTCRGFKYGNQPLHKLESSAAYESVLLDPAKAKALRIGYNPLLCHWNLNIIHLQC